MPYLGAQYYTEAGAGPALLLLHGHTLDRRMWQPALPLLTPHFRVITPDLPGHGASAPGPDGLTMPQLLIDLLDHLDLKQAAVCGLSMGGGVAVSLTLHFPERVSALIAVDSTVKGRRFAQWQGPGPHVERAGRDGLAAGLQSWLADPLFAPALRAPTADLLRAIVSQYPGHAWLGRPTAPYMPGPPETDRLGEITTPTLVMVGEHDLHDFQAVADALAGAIPGARKLLLPGAGHLPPLEQPEAFARALIDFLQPTPGA